MYRDVGDQISKRKKTLNHGQKFLPKLFLIFFILHKDKFFGHQGNDGRTISRFFCTPTFPL